MILRARCDWIKSSREIMQQHQWKRAILVKHGFHALRSKRGADRPGYCRLAALIGGDRRFSAYRLCRFPLHVVDKDVLNDHFQDGEERNGKNQADHARHFSSHEQRENDE